MTREQAQVYAKLSLEDLEKINKGYAKHYDVLCAFANGAIIEMKYMHSKVWFEKEKPYFYMRREYRVKPSAEQPAEPWKPKEGDRYYILNEYGNICVTNFTNYGINYSHIKLGNCFRTSEEAEAARERVRAALMGVDYVYIVKNVFVDYSERESSFDFDVFSNKKDAIEFFEKMIPDKLKEMELIQKSRELEIETFKYGKEELTWGCELRDKSDIVETASYTYLVRVPRYPVKSETEE